MVPLEFSSQLQEKEAILTFNLQRNKTFNQKMREAEKWGEIEEKKAEKRMEAGKKIDPSQKSDEGSKGRTADKVAEKVGLGSRDTYYKAKKVWLKAKEEKDECAQELVEEINRGENPISGAYKEIRRKEKGLLGLSPCLPSGPLPVSP